MSAASPDPSLHPPPQEPIEHTGRIESAERDALDELLPRLLDLPFAPPSVGTDARTGRRVRAEFGDFAGHAPYSPGEDLRFLDWSALARSRQRVLRRFDAVKHERLELVVDLSTSMHARLSGVRDLVRLYVFLALHRLDSVELTLLESAGPRRLRFAGALDWPRARATILELEAQGDHALRGLADAVPRLDRRAGRVLLSDLQPEAEAVRALEHAAAGGHAWICLFPRLPAEAGAASLAHGRCTLVDAESGRALDVEVSPALAAAFLDEQRAWEERMRWLCRELGHDLVVATLPPPDARATTAAWLPFLVKRGGR